MRISIELKTCKFYLADEYFAIALMLGLKIIKFTPSFMKTTRAQREKRKITLKKTVQSGPLLRPIISAIPLFYYSHLRWSKNGVMGIRGHIKLLSPPFMILLDPLWVTVWFAWGEPMIMLKKFLPLFVNRE